METKHGFTKMTLTEFTAWLKDLRVSKTVLKIQQHHTYIPSYIHFDGSNHFERQKAMKDYHVNNNGWGDIGQHFTIFPDGIILTGRGLERTPACITGQNANSVCIENLGNFDISGDTMSKEQQDSIVEVTALLCSKFNIPVSTDHIVYHHWFDLITGARNNGTKNNKSCPGSAYFGGNKLTDSLENFLPLISNTVSADIKINTLDVLRFVCVTVNSLNIRIKPNSSSLKAPDRPSAKLGAVLRVYAEQDGWLKISKSDQRWVYGRYTMPVERATVKASALNVRTGPGTTYPKTGSLPKGEIVFISETKNNWCKITMEESWVSRQYLDFNS